MNLVFDIGTAEKAKGHALIYFRNSRSPRSLLATYVIVLPVAFDISKYVPPMLASRIPQIKAEASSFVPLPPVPESVESYESLKALAELRDDDLVCAGDVDASAIDSALTALSQAAQDYANLYQDHLSHSAPATPHGDLDVKEVLYSLMSERDKLSELAKLTGKLRYAVEGNDRAQVDETVQEMEILARFLPEKYQIKNLIKMAQLTEPKGSKLAELYLDRCYKISDEEYAAIEQIDRTIRQLESEA